jgi:tRNA-2-methylthio-N6-dimethylallyladenosine synthase
VPGRGEYSKVKAESKRAASTTARVSSKSAFTFEYSPRPGPAAAEMEGHLDPLTINARFRRLSARTRELAAESNARQVGTVQTLLLEGPSKKNPRRVTGRTRGNRLVHIDARDELVAGAFANAHLTESHGHYLLGEATDAPADAPVATPAPAPQERPTAAARG